MTSHIYTHRVDETVPDLFTVETNGAGAMVVRALTASGESRWTASAPGAPVYGDSFGGIVAELRDESGDPRGLVRFAGPAGALPWRYESPGYISAGAQAPDGTIYTIELIRPAGSPGWFQGDMSVVVIDGQTGRVRARIPVPRNVQVRDVSSVYPTCATRHEVWEYTPYATRPVVSADGNGYIQLEHWTRTTRGECLETNSVNDVSKDVQQTLTLLRVQPTGVTSSETLFDFQFSGGSTACEWVPRAGSTLPDGLGGRLATWDRYQNFGCAQDYHLFATRFDATGARADHLLATSHVGAPEIVLTGDDGTAYISTYNGVPTAVDVATWTTKWTSTVAGVPVMALAGGGVVLHSGTGALSVIDGSGAITETAQFALSDPIHAAAGRWVGVSSPLGGPQLMAVTGPALMEAAFSFQRGRGNRQAQRAQKVPTLVHLVPAPILRNAPEFYHAWHLEAAINAAVGAKANPLFYNVDAATRKSFTEELMKARDAVAFIGHSLRPVGLDQSVGLQLADGFIVKRTTPQYGPVDGAPYTIVDRIESNAKIVFVASCRIGPEFLSLWDINASTSNRALIVPVGTETETNLYAAALAWIAIATKLGVDGLPVGQAVAAGNVVLQNNGVPESELRFQVIGGTSVRIK
jgi:hypothetical protein